MRTLRVALAGALLFPALGPLYAQDYAPPPSKPPDEATRQAIDTRMNKLHMAITALRRQRVSDPALADVEVYYKAAAWITRHNEFYQGDAGAWTVEALDRGLLRASQLAQGELPWLFIPGQPIVRGYRSRVDGSIQPFAVTYPAEYGRNLRKKWRLDVVLHGREPSLTEVRFLHEHNGNTPATKGQDFIQLDIYGRGNNAYRWAGEADVFEAIDAFAAVERGLGRAELLDPDRVVLRGFSMGGAGTWHIGLHHPARWCVIGPGAGFTTTHGYVKDLPEKLPPAQEACLRIYDAALYAENAANVPVVAYAGDQDPQMQAARNIEDRLKPLGIPMTLLVAPGLGHRFPPEWQAKAEALYAKHGVKGRDDDPDHVHFVTYTLKYSGCAWVEIIGLDRHYYRTLVDARRTKGGIEVKTENVRILRLGVPAGTAESVAVKIDGQTLSVRLPQTQGAFSNIYLERQGRQWRSVLPQKLLVHQSRRLQKSAGVQGPIDDAFMDRFLCVRGTGKPWHATTEQYADASLKRFEEEWDRYLRGTVPVKDDLDVTDDDIATRNLVLFGDPSSNALLAQILDDLPLSWTREEIKLGEASYKAADHVPVLIFPSPLNPRRYVVVNSGHTFHAADFRGTNALLFPRLGDYAVLKLAGTEKDPLAVEIAASGLFDEYWQPVNPASAGP
jgi:predicted esterase